MEWNGLKHLLDISFAGLMFGMAGTGVGGLVGLLIDRAGRKFLSFILEFSAGLMMAVVCFQLLPVAFEEGGAVAVFSGVIAGILLIIIIDDLIRRVEFFKSGTGSKGILKAGILMAIGIALHNFPEGFAVGSGFEASPALGLTLAFVIAVHDIPEGIAISVPMRAGGFSKASAFVITLLSGLPMGIGALFGAMLGSISHSFIAVCLGFAGGAMLYIVTGELIPESKALHRGRLSSLGNILGMLCGLAISILS